MSIQPIYKNLKEEIIDKLDYKQYELTYKKCKQYSNDEIKYGLKSGLYNHLFHYDIEVNTIGY